MCLGLSTQFRVPLFSRPHCLCGPDVHTLAEPAFDGLGLAYYHKIMRVNPVLHVLRFFPVLLLCLAVFAGGAGRMTAHAIVMHPQSVDIAGIKVPICTGARSSGDPVAPPPSHDGVACCILCLAEKIAAPAPLGTALVVPMRRIVAFAPPHAAVQIVLRNRGLSIPIRGPPHVV